MGINKVNFYNVIRQTFIKKLSNKQVEGFEAVLEEFMSKYSQVPKWREKLAYCLATFYHESAFTMNAIEEYGKGAGKRYGKRVKMDGTKYTDVPHIFYGRGPVQLTWYENYEKMSKYAGVGVDLVKNPELMLELETSVRVSIAGLIYGEYTGRSLSRYFSENINDPYNARKIVNGMKVDEKNPEKKVDVPAKNIEKYYYKFLSAIQLYPNP